MIPMKQSWASARLGFQHCFLYLYTDGGNTKGSCLNIARLVESSSENKIYASSSYYILVSQNVMNIKGKP